MMDKRRSILPRVRDLMANKLSGELWGAKHRRLYALYYSTDLDQYMDSDNPEQLSDGAVVQLSTVRQVIRRMGLPNMVRLPCGCANTLIIAVKPSGRYLS